VVSEGLWKVLIDQKVEVWGLNPKTAARLFILA